MRSRATSDRLGPPARVARSRHLDGVRLAHQGEEGVHGASWAAVDVDGAVVRTEVEVHPWQQQRSEPAAQVDEAARRAPGCAPDLREEAVEIRQALARRRMATEHGGAGVPERRLAEAAPPGRPQDRQVVVRAAGRRAVGGHCLVEPPLHALDGVGLAACPRRLLLGKAPDERGVHVPIAARGATALATRPGSMGLTDPSLARARDGVPARSAAGAARRARRSAGRRLRAAALPRRGAPAPPGQPARRRRDRCPRSPRR